MTTGIVGRIVMVEVTRGEKSAMEPCEVVACEFGYLGGYSSGFRNLVATNDGSLLTYDPAKATLVAVEDNGGPYR